MSKLIFFKYLAAAEPAFRMLLSVTLLFARVYKLNCLTRCKHAYRALTFGLPSSNIRLNYSPMHYDIIEHSKKWLYFVFFFFFDFLKKTETKDKMYRIWWSTNIESFSLFDFYLKLDFNFSHHHNNIFSCRSSLFYYLLLWTNSLIIPNALL